MSNTIDWDKQACNLLKSELARRGLSYEDLRLALEQIGVHKTKNNITKTRTNKILFFINKLLNLIR